jgi:hypothetical protein
MERNELNLIPIQKKKKNIQNKVSPPVWRTLMDFIEVPIPHPHTPITGTTFSPFFFFFFVLFPSFP